MTGHDEPASTPAATGAARAPESAAPPATERGRLAQIIATRGGLAPPEAPFVIEHREALIYMLCEAAELEHGIMCQYLFAAFTLKQDEGEGLTPEELAAARRWRKVISHVATQEMLHLALVQNLLSAVGAAPHLSRPNFPHPASHYPAGVHLALLPFGEQALRHFMFLERPEGMDLNDGDGLAAFGRAVPHMMASDIVPRGQDFSTVGHMYRSIEAGFAHLSAKYGEKWLFVGPPRAQATQQHFRWPELVAVTDLASAQRAIDEILEQGEGPRGHWESAHFGQFVTILDEFEQARVANRGLVPARPVLPVNVRPCDRDVEVPLTDDPVTAKVMDLFNVAYEILLQIFERFFAHTDETDAQLKALADATIALMFQVIKPLGDLITTLPAGPSYRGVNAGPSFELFYESDYLLPHRDAAWALLTERLDVAAEFCQQIVADQAGTQPHADQSRAGQARDLSAPLQPVGTALADIARALSVHLPAYLSAYLPVADPRSRSAGPAVAPADAGALLARAGEFGRTRLTAMLNTDAAVGVAEVFDRTYAIVTRLARSASPGGLAGAPPRLVDSVLRPLADVLRCTAPVAGSGPTAATPAPAAPAPAAPAPAAPAPATPATPAATSSPSAPEVPEVSAAPEGVSAGELPVAGDGGGDEAVRPAARHRRCAARAGRSRRRAPGRRVHGRPGRGPCGPAAAPPGQPARQHPGRAGRPLPGHQRADHPDPPRPAAAHAAPGGPLPLRQFGAQAVLRRLARRGVQRRQGPEPGPGPARRLPRRAGHDLRQSRHLPALGPVHRPAEHGLPDRPGAVRRAERRADGRDHPGRP